MVERCDLSIEEALNDESSRKRSSDPASSKAAETGKPGAASPFKFSEDAEVHLWSFNLELTTVQMERFSQTLSERESERAARFRFDRHRHRYVAAHGCVRELLGRYLSVSPANVPFGFGPRGKPSVDRGVSGLEFNLAHSEAQGLLAVSPRFRVGVDLEHVRTLPDAQELVERFFSLREREHFNALPEEGRAQAFFNLWTRKEAWLKATGEGIAHLLAQVEVSFLPQDEPRLIALPAEYAKSAGQWSLWSMVPADGFIGALAVETPGVKPVLRRWDWQRKEITR